MSSHRNPLSIARLGRRARPALLLAALAAGAPPTLAAEPTGEAIYAYCKGCHGSAGGGGEDGKYPRIAGLPAAYLERQLHAFRDQTRINKPMIPIFKHVRFDDRAIATVAAYVAALPVPDLRLWPYTPDAAAVASFASRAAYRAAGQAIYAERCATCHGRRGAGEVAAGAPPLVAQHPAYLAKQIGDFAARRRAHAAADRCGEPDHATADSLIDHLIDLGR